MMSLNANWAQGQKQVQLIIDADTGNEVDDYYALARAFIEPSWDILSLSAAQWESSHWTVPHSMENSHRLNQVLISEMDVPIRTIRGGVDRMFDWGDQAQHSAAAYEIIKRAKEQSEGEQLTVVALGALTNVASAIYIEPEIASKIKLYWLGTTYDFQEDILKKQDFNCIMDQQALEVILMSSVELHIMPVSLAVEMAFSYEETEANLPKGHKVSRLLLDRWFEHLDGGRKERIPWDLALIQAMIFPEWAEQKKIVTSKENGAREVNYYSAINVAEMKREFFDSLQSFLGK